MNGDFAPLAMDSHHALRSQASHAFRWARARAAREKLSGRLTGQAVNLLPCAPQLVGGGIRLRI